MRWLDTRIVAQVAPGLIQSLRSGLIVHQLGEAFEDDLPLLRSLVPMVMEEPGASESVEVRFRDAWGEWVLMDVCVLNVLEAPPATTRDFS